MTSSPTPRRIFVAGATGATGRTFVRLADAGGVDVVPHLRRRHAGPTNHPRAAVFDLEEHEALVECLRRATTVVQLIGTMRKRFAVGDTYESSDVGTTQQLVTAARAAGSVDHVILLSSVGAGRPMGAYLQAKARAEAIVRDSGIPFTIFRPSAFVGEGHHPPAGLGLLTRLPGLGRYKPITVDDLARTLLQVAVTRRPLDTVLEGEDLWREVEKKA